MDPRDLPRRIGIVERAGFRDGARWLRGLARSLGVRVPPPASRAVELPALDGFEGADLDALGVPWRRMDDGRLVIVIEKGGA